METKQGISTKIIELPFFAGSLSFFNRSLFHLVLRLEHVLASNCDLYFGHLLSTRYSLILAVISCLPIAPHILLLAHVHLATVTPEINNRLCRPVGVGKNNCKTLVSRLRYCIPLFHTSQ
jgi:hypothetical protein